MKDRRQTTKTPARIRIGAVVSSCLVALFAALVCFSLLPQRPVPATQEPEQQANEAMLEKSAEQTGASEEDASPYEIGSTGAEYEKGKVLISVDKGMDIASVNAVLANCDFVATKSVTDEDLVAGFAEIELESGMKVETAVIRLNGNGLKAQPNYIFHAAEDADEKKASLPLLVNPLSDESIETQAVEINDASRTSQWMLDSIDAYKAWGIQKAGDSGVSIAVIDTGTLTSHPDLQANIKSDAYNSAEEKEGFANVQDAMGHGTHVAGIASARTNNGTGVSGVSYNAGLVIIKASMKKDGVESQDFNTATLARGITWLLDESNGTSIAQKHNVKVINMSVGGAGTVDASDVLYKKITEARGKGILTVCAAGNSDSGTPPYNVIPGDYKDCLSVISLQHSTSGAKNDAAGAFNVSKGSSSNYNAAGTTSSSASAKNISAPGISIYSTTNDGSYGNKNGTSMASPCVAASAALIYANKPSLSAENVQELLCVTATDINTTGWDSETGYGEVSPYRALQITSATIAADAITYQNSTPLTLASSDGSSISGTDWEWTSSDSNIIAIDKDAGIMRGVSIGTATVTATYSKASGISTQKTITVVPAISTNDLTYLEDAQLAFQSSDGATHISDWKWESSNPSVLAIDESAGVLNATGVGTATITATNKANSKLKTQKSISVGALNLNKVVIEDIDDRVYNGSAIEPEPSVSYNGKKLQANTDYHVSYMNNTSVGMATLNLTKGTASNCTGNVSTTFTILKADLANAEIEVPPHSYTGSAVTPRPVVRLDGKQIPETDYNLSYANNVEMGNNATVTITGKGNNVGGTQVANFSITAKSLANATIALISSETYTGESITPKPEVKLGSVLLKEGVNFSYSYENNTNAGTATLIVNGINGYEGKVVETFTINKANLENATIDTVDSHSYTGSEIKPQPVIRLNGKQIPSSDYALSYANNVESGNATVNINGNGANVIGSKTVNFSITKVGMNTAIISAISSVTYTGSAITPKPVITFGSAHLQEGKDFSYSYESNVNAGKATVIVSGMKNFEGTIEKVFTINPANIANASVDSVSSQYYTGSAITPKPAVTYQGKALTAGKDFTYQYVKNTNTGTAQILINAAGSNFTGYKIVTFEIVKKPTSSQGSSSSSSAAKPSSSSGTSTSSAATNQTPDRWEKVGTKWRYMYGTAKQKSTGKKYPKSEFLTINGTRYHFDSSGYMHTGWQTISGSKYYFASSGAMSKNWLKLNSTWYYMGSDGKMRKGWQTISGSKYYFTSSGVMTTGWQKLSGKWYYMGSEGKMRKGWQTISKTKYYFKSNGVMATGWQTISGSKYYFRSSGTVATGWLKLSGKWYYLNSSGKMLTGWQTISKTKYYFKSNGVMATGWLKISGKWSYFKSSGSMSKGWQKIGGLWYHLGTDGKMLTGWQKIGGKWYYLKSSGAMATGWQKISGKWYYLNASGAMISSKWVGNYWVGSNGAMATSAWVDGGRYYVNADGVWVPGKRR